MQRSKDEKMKYSLMILSQKILDNQKQDEKTLIKQLLLNLDKYGFINLKQEKQVTFTQLKYQIEKYYQRKFNQHIKWQSLEINQLFNQFWYFVFDLYLKSNKNDIMQAYVNLPEQNQNNLQQFIKNVMNREQYIQNIKQSSFNMNSSKNSQLQEQNQRLKLQKDSLQKNYQLVFEQLQQQKQINNKLSYETNQLKAWKVVIVNEFGDAENAEDLVERIKNEIFELQRRFELVQKQLQQKNKLFKTKQEYINKEQIRNQEQIHIIQSKYKSKIFTLNKQIKDLETKSDNFLKKIKQLQSVVKSKQNQINDLTKKIHNLETVNNKYSAISQLCKQFKNKVIQQYKKQKQVSPFKK